MTRHRLQIHPRRHAHGAEGERGQVLVLFTIVLVAILAFTALVVDIGLLRNDRQSLVNAVDAGALAGGTLMPVDGSVSGDAAKVTALIDQTVQATYPGLSRPGNYEISYRCLVGTGAGNAGAFDSPDIDAFIPQDCDPSPSLGRSAVVGDFTGAGKTRTSACSPALGDKCNVVVVDGNVTTGYRFARVVGVESGNTGVVQSAACRGLCGVLPDIPFDVVLVMDTSGSMQTNYAAGQPRIYWAKKAANELLDSLEAARGTQQVGVARFSGNYDVDPPASSVLSNLTTNFAAIRTAIAPLSGAGNTPLKQGLARGVTVMTAGARSGVEQVFILLSDGRPWLDVLGNARPTAADIAAFRGAADQVYSVLIGPPTPGCTNSSACLDIPLMQSIAKAKDGKDGTQDPSHFLHVVDASDLPDVFKSIATELLNPKSHLIQLYPKPIVTGVGGGTTVSISGKYFTGATRVTFGGTNAVTFDVNSDTSITATAPAGTSGQTVHVRVTTSGGSSPATAADEYTYP